MLSYRTLLSLRNKITFLDNQCYLIKKYIKIYSREIKIKFNYSKIDMKLFLLAKYY